jgi:hypothetical protein
MRSATSCLAALALAAVFRLAVADTAWEGRKLSDYLDFLNSQGSRVIYTSDLVANHMLLSREPAGDASADGLADLLHAFGLTVTAGPADSLLVVRLPSEVEAASRPAAPEDVAIPEIIVTSSLHRLDYSPPLTHTYLDRELATRIPTTADEAVRLTNRLPGTANGGVSSRNHIRGGEVNEVLFLFDGLRLYEPWHFKDFQAIATIVNSSAVGGMDFYTGAYPAHFGDRMSGGAKLLQCLDRFAGHLRIRGTGRLVAVGTAWQPRPDRRFPGSGLRQPGLPGLSRPRWLGVRAACRTKRQLPGVRRQTLTGRRRSRGTSDGRLFEHGLLAQVGGGVDRGIEQRDDPGRQRHFGYPQR